MVAMVVDMSVAEEVIEPVIIEEDPLIVPVADEVPLAVAEAVDWATEELGAPSVIALILEVATVTVLSMTKYGVLVNMSVMST